MSALFTIGHSNLPLGVFLANLEAHGIETLVDIRSSPRSRFAHFNGRAPAAALPQGTAYRFMGDSLGGRPPEPDCYDAAGHVLYRRVAKLQRFAEGIEELAALGLSRRTAMMCSEGDPAGCHRTLLVARVLVERGHDPAGIWHILPGGSARAHGGLIAEAGLAACWRSPLPVRR